jgi:hypothetical protein
VTFTWASLQPDSSAAEHSRVVKKGFGIAFGMVMGLTVPALMG